VNVDRPLPRGTSPDEHWAPDHLVLDRKALTHAGRLIPQRDADGHLLEHSPLAGMAAVEQRYPAWALGPFGIIEPERDLPDSPGVFALVEEGTVRYVGSSRDLARTFTGRTGVGSISRRDCQSPGGEERCRLNRLIITAARAGRVVDLYVLLVGSRRRGPVFLRRRQAEERDALAAQLAGVAKGSWHLPR
jgi:hypothetical protein